MKIEYKNLYTHFVFTTLHRLPVISEEHRQRIEKYITGIVNHHDCRLYAIYANPEHVHLLVSRVSNMNEEQLANLIAEGSSHFINENKLCMGNFQYRLRVQHFLSRKGMWIKYANIF